MFTSPGPVHWLVTYCDLTQLGFALDPDEDVDVDLLAIASKCSLKTTTFET